MIAVLFEAWPRPDQREAYLSLAAGLAPTLRGMDGFISVERFQSLTDPNKVLSLSFWRDEAAVAAWRANAPHRAAQRAGRGGVFVDYALKVAEVRRAYGMDARDEAPDGFRAPHP